MKKLILIVLIILLSNVVFATEIAKDNVSQTKYSLGSKENPIKVGVQLVDPFALKYQGIYQGLVIDYWKNIAKENNWHYVFLDTTPSYEQSLRDTESGIYDVVLGNFSTTSERISFINYARPFMLNKISILTSNKTSAFTIFLNVFYSIFEFFSIIFIVIAFFALIFWFLKPTDDKTTLYEYFMISCVNILAVPDSSRFKKGVLITLLFTGLIAKALLIGNVTSTLFGLSLGEEPFLSEKDIANKLFVVVKGSSFVQKMRSLNARVYEFDGNNEQAAEFYARNIDKYAGYVSDYALIYKYSNQFKNIEPSLIASSYNVRNDILAFAFNYSFPFGRELNVGILKLQDTNAAYSICNVYVGDYAKNCLM